MSIVRDIPVVSSLEVAPSPLSRSEVISGALASESSLGEDGLALVGMDALRLLMASLKGLIELKPTELKIASDIFRKLVSDAPKSIRVEHAIKPEEYIREAVEGNAESFAKLRVRAAEYAEEVAVINAEFYEVLEGKL